MTVRGRSRWLLFATLFVVILRGADAPRTAVLDFTLPSGAGSQDPVAADFSHAVQARLLTNPDYTWIERQEMERLVKEVDLGGIGGSDATAAVRLGHWLRADLLLRGEMSVRAPGQGELTLEVIDAKRADLLATRVAPVALDARQRPQPTSEEIAAVASAALDALKAAGLKQEENRRLHVIAPLYFKNIGPTDRLNYMEERLQAALGREAVAAKGFHVLQFPRSEVAGEESDLVVAGMTDTDPEAWQQVADTYLWGTIEEKPADGVPFEDVPVTMILQAWNGAGPAQEIRWEGLVRNLDQGVQSLMADALRVVQAAARDARDKAQRQRIAASLAARAEEATVILEGSRLDENRWASGEAAADFARTTAGQHWRAYRLRLLETACFFDAQNRTLQDQRLDLKAASAKTLRERWRHLADLRAHARRFERRPDGSFDETVVVRLTAWLMHLCEENSVPRHALLDWWRREVIAANRAAGQTPPPAWLMKANETWFREFRNHLSQENRIQRREAWEQLWPWFKEDLGRQLRSYTNDRLSDPESADILRIYEAFGDTDRAIGMLDQAWQASVAIEPETAVAGTRAKAKPRVDLSWSPAVQPAPNNPQATNVTGLPPGHPMAKLMAGTAQPPLMELKALVREIELWPKKYYRKAEKNESGPLVPYTARNVDAMAWHQGRLWIAETTNLPLPKEAGPANPEGGHYLWSYDPALHQADLATTRLEGGHTSIRTLLSLDDELWLGLDGEGVWRWNPAGAAPRKFKGEDGLVTSIIGAGQVTRSALFFLGGAANQAAIAQFEVATGSWSTVPVAPPADPARPAQSSHVPNMTFAISGDWLCLTNPTPMLYNLTTKTWLDPKPNLNLPAHVTPRGMGNFRGSTNSADERGFWIGAQDVVRFIDLQATDQMHMIRVPGRAVAMAHGNSDLWVRMEEKEPVRPGDPPGLERINFRLARIDKGSLACVSVLRLPSGRWSRLLAAEGRIWVGGNGLLEITPEGKEPGRAGFPGRDFPLHRAAWAGDLAGLKAQLAGKPDVNQATAHGWTPLLAAVQAGQGETTRVLLEAGADPNRAAHDGTTALQLAGENGDLVLSEVLLANGASPNRSPERPVRGFETVYRSMVHSAPHVERTSAPRQPAGLQASRLPDGSVELSWQDLADNEDNYEVRRTMAGESNESRAWTLPANTTRWVDRPVETVSPALFKERPTERAVIYQVRATNVRGSAYGTGGIEKKNLPTANSVLTLPPADETTVLPDWYRQPGRVESLLLPKTNVSPLMEAAGQGATDLVDRLLQRGAQPNWNDRWGRTALLLAVRSGHYATGRRLVAAGADLTQEDITGETPFIAAYNRHDDQPFLQEMLDKLEPEPRWQAASGLMYLAAEGGQIRDLEMLRAHGGDLGAGLGGGESLLSVAISFKQTETAVWLIRAGVPIQNDLQGFAGPRPILPQVLSDVVYRQDTEVVEALMAIGYDPGRPVGWASSLVSEAVRADKLELVRFLKTHGMDLNRKLDDGGTLLALAGSEAMRTLLSEKPTTWPWPRIPQQGPDEIHGGKTPTAPAGIKLFEACRSGTVALADEALAEGAVLDTRNETGITPLCLAIRSGSLPLVRRLIAAGANVDMRTGGGFGPLSFCSDVPALDMVELLLGAGADPNGGYAFYTPLYTAVQYERPDIVARLLAAGADPSLCSTPANWSYRSNPLAMALETGSAKTVELLLAAGANPRARLDYFFARKGGRDSRLYAPSLLMFAAKGGNVELIRQAISWGQDPKFQTDDGYDALAFAAREGKKEAVEFLLPQSPPKGRALESALEKGHTEIAEMLRHAGYQ